MLGQYGIYFIVCCGLFLRVTSILDTTNEGSTFPPSSAASTASSSFLPASTSSSGASTIPEGASILAALEGGTTNYKVNILPYGTSIKASNLEGKYAYSYPMQSNGITFSCYVEGTNPESGSTKGIDAAVHKPVARIALDNVVKHLNTDQPVENQGCFSELYDNHHHHQFFIEVCPNQYVTIRPSTPTSTGSTGKEKDTVPLMEIVKAKYKENTDKLVTTPDGNSFLEQIYSFSSSPPDTSSSSSSSSSVAPDFSVKILYVCSSVTRSLLPLFIQKVDHQSNSNHYIVTIGTNDPSFCQSLPSIQRLLAPIHNVCLERVENWWTYELCIGNRLRQYHDENGKAVQESIIGVYDTEYGEKLQTAGVGTAAAVLQHYRNGSPCDIRNGVPREAIVKYECMPSMGNSGSTTANIHPTGGVIGEGMHQLALVGIQEGPTCVYTFRIATALVCEYPDISPAKAVAMQAPPTNILCIPAEDDLYADL